MKKLYFFQEENKENKVFKKMASRVRVEILMDILSTFLHFYKSPMYSLLIKSRPVVIYGRFTSILFV